jgi:hypothetical protein
MLYVTDFHMRRCIWIVIKPTPSATSISVQLIALKQMGANIFISHEKDNFYLSYDYFLKERQVTQKHYCRCLLPTMSREGLMDNSFIVMLAR